MKTILSFLIVIYFSFSYSQYTPTLDPDNAWIVSSFFWDFENNQMDYTDYQIRMTDETIIYNDKEYIGFEQRTRQRIDDIPQTNWSSWETVPYYLSENISEKKVYIYYPEEYLGHESGEFLLYDFNMQIGDFITFEGFVEGEIAEPAEVTDITYESVYGMDNVKTFHFANQEYFQFTVYEGIGSTHGLFTSSFMSDAGWKLTDFGTDMGSIDVSASESKVYPNPFTSQIQIESQKPIRELQLFDMNGKLIHLKSTLTELNSNLSQLKPSIYILKITYKDNQKEIIRLIKK